MKTATQRMAWLAGAFALAIAASTVNAQASEAFDSYSTARPATFGTLLVSPPRKVSRRQMQWYRWHPAARSLQGRAAKFGSRAVIGLESMRDLAALRKRYDFDRVFPIPALHAVQVSVDAAQVRALLATAPTDRLIRYVAPVVPLRRTTSMPNDPFLHTIDPATGFPYQWAFAAAHVDQALAFTPGSPTVVVGVIDTGVEDVPDLKGKIDSIWTANGTTITQAPREGNDRYGHGTAVTSVIAANVDDRFGMAGFGGATHVTVVHASIENTPFFDDLSVATALTFLDSLGVRIVNMSLGGDVPTQGPLLDAIHKAAADGVLLVAASGNASAGSVSWPAADLQPSDGGRSYGLSVGAVNHDGQRATFSNWGKHLSLVAPGAYGGQCSGVLVALPTFSAFDESCYFTWMGEGGGHYGNLPGTSFAAPEVSGVAALIWAARPGLKNYQVADIIKQSARRAGTRWTPDLGCGILDAGAALELAMSRTADEWAEQESPGDDVCSTGGAEPPTWPTERNQTITFDPIESKTIGDSDFMPKASASSGLPLTFTATGDCIVVVNAVHLTGAGSCSITASQEGDASYNAATSVSQSFAIADVPARKGVAVPASGRPGTSVKLPFRVGAGNGDVAASIAVQKNGTTVARLNRNFFPVETGHVYGLSWKAPKARTSAAYRFCVTLSDRAGRQTAPSCARIRLR